jgi:hypothetical protein
MIKNLRLLLLVLLASCGDISKYNFKPCLEAGTAGCQCLSNATCASASLTCSDGVCKTPKCEPGQPGGSGCNCGDATDCAVGLLCDGTRCVSDTGQTLIRPANPICYTPCREGVVTADGRTLECSKEGLIEGCIGDALCIDGSCQLESDVSKGPARAEGSATTATGENAKTCTSDSACPDFQSCVSGQCYSDCAQDSDCRSARKCFKKACRVPCVTGANTGCPSAHYCASQDGTTGFCLPVAVGATGSTGVAALAGYTLTPTVYEFTKDKQTQTFKIVSTSKIAERFTITKTSHREFKDAGPVLIQTAALQWVSLADQDAAPAKTQTITVEVPANGERSFTVSSTENPLLARWDGTLTVTHPTLGNKTISLSYVGTLEGQWSGTAYFLSNFGTNGLDAWLADKGNKAKLGVVGNALVRRWAAYRESRISLDEFKAVLTATQTGSWRWPEVQARCPSTSSPNPNVGCYLYNNGVGLSIYSDYLPDNPVPSGITELPIAFNMHKDPTATSDQSWAGKIISEASLQYAGSPRVDVHFSNDPNTCSLKIGDACLTMLDKFEADIYVGGRYRTEATDTNCSRATPGTFVLQRTPWLVPGFEKGTTFDAVSGGRNYYECRDEILPFGDVATVNTLNASLAAANPVPDGATRKRKIKLIDGAIIDRDVMFVLFKEEFPSFLDPTDPTSFGAYGYMLLNRQRTVLTAADYEGAKPQDFRPVPVLPKDACTDDLLDTLAGGALLSASNASAVGIGVVQGVIPTVTPPTVIDASHPEKVHYFCEDTGLFDGGPGDNGSANPTKVGCPAQSLVRFFTLRGANATQASVAGQACQNTRTCGATLATWISSNYANIRIDPVFKCTATNEVFCSLDRNDLRLGKTFYGAEVTEAVLPALDEAIAQAFRYKTRFRNRSGTSLGFAPDTCAIDGSVPYCYDPALIETIAKRVDCAAHIYTNYYSSLTQDARATLKSFLVRNYSYSEVFVFGLPAPVIYDGFERLNSELLIMLGDEGFTASFTARFDLAGQKLASFEGSKLEPNGIDLSGGAGFEMYRLYQATQYYQLALDRFYGQSGLVWTSLRTLPSGEGFITQATATSYLDRLIRASSQKSRAWSEIAKRYMSFNRPDLARLVVSRAYTQAYLESVILSRMMSRIVDVSSTTARAQIIKLIDDAALTYRVALLDMRNAYQDITDQTTQFGFPLGYIPFPALDPLDDNAFEKVLSAAKTKLEVARSKEQTALSDTRTFDVDSASFQSELAALSSSYEDQLAEICGSFTVQDAGQTKVFPAIPKYAFMSEKTRLLGDPCGLMGNGALHDAFAQLELARLDYTGIELSRTNLMADIADAEAQTTEQCGRITTFANAQFDSENDKLSFQDGINSLNLINETAQNVLSIVEKNTDFIKCVAGVATDCPQAAVAAGVYNGVAIATTVLTAINSAIIVGLERKIGDIEASQVRDEILQECEAAKIDKKYAVKGFMRRATEIELELVKQQYNIKLTLSTILKLRNDSLSLMSSQQDSEQLRINVEAARNDPNVRIYRNDAVYAAERTFDAARKEAFKATRVFEYYTSQSYAALDKLFLVRMVERGDFTLESYLSELEEAFAVFQETYGNPDARVTIVSLRDDIMNIERVDAAGRALSEADRTKLFRTRLQNVSWLDNRGYITLPFSTGLAQLSPLTANHKVLFVEAEVVGGDVGDAVGRVYLTQKGTGTVRPLAGTSNSFFAFPERTAVVNTFFNGEKPLASEVYRTERLRDRPLVNTGWQLIINKKDEAVNSDIRLDSLSDVKLYLYYTDFTTL